tara:strand:+ start:301 stop:840 length:540 start_codon:yes stop_codon:yes gene_type:complete
MRRTDISEGPFGNLANGFAKGFQAGKKSPGMLNRAVDNALNPDGKSSDSTRVSWKPIPVEPVKVDSQQPVPKSVKEIPVGTGFKDKQSSMWQWAGQQWVKKTPNGWQGGQLTNDAAFAMYIDALKRGNAYKPITRENEMTTQVNQKQQRNPVKEADKKEPMKKAVADKKKMQLKKAWVI